jgi:hypothetical protein
MVHKVEALPQERPADLNEPERTKALAPAFMCTYMYVTALYTPSHRGPNHFTKEASQNSFRGMAAHAADLDEAAESKARQGNANQVTVLSLC